eukprot:5482121-Prymnesium_polylepis.1
MARSRPPVSTIVLQLDMINVSSAMRHACQWMSTTAANCEAGRGARAVRWHLSPTNAPFRCCANQRVTDDGWRALEL